MKNEIEVTVSEFRQDASDLINEVRFGKKTLILVRRGRQMGAIVSMEMLKKIREVKNIKW